VTLRVVAEVWNIRGAKLFRSIHACLVEAATRFKTRIIQYSVQSNHIHLIVEAEDRPALTRAMKGLSIRLALAINRLMKRRGPVFADRYHAHILETPLEAKRALLYVINNARKHALQRGRELPPEWLDPCSSARAFDGWACPRSRARDAAVVPPNTWLLRVGWKRHGLLEQAAVPTTRSRTTKATPVAPIFVRY
jgi:REP element-mobilizing transposase RayT